MTVTSVTACHMQRCDANQARIYWGYPLFSLSVTPSLATDQERKRGPLCDSVTSVTNARESRPSCCSSSDLARPPHWSSPAVSSLLAQLCRFGRAVQDDATICAHSPAWLSERVSRRADGDQFAVGPVVARLGGLSVDDLIKHSQAVVANAGPHGIPGLSADGTGCGFPFSQLLLEPLAVFPAVGLEWLNALQRCVFTKMSIRKPLRAAGGSQRCDGNDGHSQDAGRSHVSIMAQEPRPALPVFASY